MNYKINTARVNLLLTLNQAIGLKKPATSNLEERQPGGEQMKKYKKTTFCRSFGNSVRSGFLFDFLRIFFLLSAFIYGLLETIWFNSCRILAVVEKGNRLEVAIKHKLSKHIAPSKIETVASFKITPLYKSRNIYIGTTSINTDSPLIHKDISSLSMFEDCFCTGIAIANSIPRRVVTIQNIKQKLISLALVGASIGTILH